MLKILVRLKIWKNLEKVRSYEKYIMKNITEYYRNVWQLLHLFIIAGNQIKEYIYISIVVIRKGRNHFSKFESNEGIHWTTMIESHENSSSHLFYYISSADASLKRGEGSMNAAVALSSESQKFRPRDNLRSGFTPRARWITRDNRKLSGRAQFIFKSSSRRRHFIQEIVHGRMPFHNSP